MTQLNEEFLERQFKNGDYSPLINLMLVRRCRKGKFSSEEIYHEVAEKFAALNKEMPLIALTDLSDCLDKFISDGYLNECGGMYYPTGKKKSVKHKVVVE